MPLKSRISLMILAVCLLAAPALAGYKYPLPSPEIRDAYFLGKATDNHAAEFLATYRRWLTQPQTDRYTITEIEVMTPYAQIVHRGEKNTPGDSEVQTETDERLHPLPFIVRVAVTRSLIYPGDAGLGIEQGPAQDFSIELDQGQTLPSLRMTKSSFGGKHCPCGVIIKAEFDPSKIVSAPMHVIVRTPEGQNVSADFDMSKLK